EKPAGPKEKPGAMKEKSRFTDFEGAIKSVAFSTDGKRALAAGRDTSVRFCDHALRSRDLETGEGPAEPRGYRCGWLDRAADGGRYLIGGHTATPVMRVADVDTGQKLGEVSIGPQVDRGRLSRNGRYIILYWFLVMPIPKDTQAVRVFDVKS